MSTLCSTGLISPVNTLLNSTSPLNNQPQCYYWWHANKYFFNEVAFFVFYCRLWTHTVLVKKCGWVDWRQRGQGVQAISRTHMLLVFCEYSKESLCVPQTVVNFTGRLWLLAACVCQIKCHSAVESMTHSKSPEDLFYIVFFVFVLFFLFFQVGEHSGHGCFARHRRCAPSLVLRLWILAPGGPEL